jgi:hypothetical protein
METPPGAPRDLPLLVQIAGGSMEPSLCRGWRVLVHPTAIPPHAGDLVLIRVIDGSLIHRVVVVARFRAGLRIFHRGDAGGGIGLSRPEDVLGRVTSIVEPPARPLPTQETLSLPLLRSLRGARRRCRLYTLARNLAERLAIDRLLPRGTAAGPLRRLLR